MQKGKARYSTSNLGALHESTRSEPSGLGKADESYEKLEWHQGRENLTLSADDLKVIKWYVDASFALHPDFKSHTGAMMMLGKGSIQSIARKQKMNVHSSTEGKLLAVDDTATMILWTKLFLEAQGYDVDKNIVYQDNKSAILLETNGKKSSGKRTHALNIHYFFITDQVEKGNAQIEHCGTTTTWSEIFLRSPSKMRSSKDFRTISLDVNETHRDTRRTERDVT
jgi:hypothetical protein